MGDLHKYNTSHNYSSHLSNISYAYYNYINDLLSILNVVTSIVLVIGLPLTLVAICALFSQVRNDNVAPIYVINLLISDLIQFCCMIAEMVQPEDRVVLFIYGYSVFASVGFMVCIAMERYLVIVFPLWYRFRRTIKTSVLVCVVVWVLPLACFLPTRISTSVAGVIILPIFLFLPLPLLIFFMGGTLRALSASISVRSDEKRRIAGMLVLVLLIYILLFLPFIILMVAGELVNVTLVFLSLVLIRLCPLVDLVLYVFMRKGTTHSLLASVRCCRMDSNEIRSPAVAVVMTCPDSASRSQRQTGTGTETETETETGTETGTCRQKGQVLSDKVSSETPDCRYEDASS
ncbi:ovarian cancer G-protein coupled receptor 1-like [Epinephelus fuscoguttatus]|uniref:ovarian cancer G-protein coupled receptor 1-like n=1 Tax=Epinephelus fuscoguttatus TaxID=293821 RepID=UPI0020D0A646|nr:ovarian cancer G-protein coupled receptor 1-like [Epinephelus fuscoguttatus]